MHARLQVVVVCVSEVDDEEAVEVEEFVAVDEDAHANAQYS